MRRAFFLLALGISTLALLNVVAQTPAPIIIQAVTPATAATTKTTAVVPENGSQSTMQLLQDMQATNAATIKKQEAALATLDELQKAAEELKIFSKRG